MAEFKRLLAQLCCDEKQEEEILSYASACGNDGADGLVFVDNAKTDEAHELHIGLIRKMARAIDIPIFAGGRVKRLEDVKNISMRAQRRIPGCVPGRECRYDQGGSGPLRQ